MATKQVIEKVTKELDGISYQCELPQDVEVQLDMLNMIILEAQLEGLELAKVKKELDKQIIANSSIATEKDDLLVNGDKRKGLQAKHLLQLGAIYRAELLFPLCS